MNNVLEVTAKSVYGNVLLYPANDQAKLLARITGTRTLGIGALQLARGMGFDVRVSGDAAVKATEILK